MFDSILENNQHDHDRRLAAEQAAAEKAAAEKAAADKAAAEETHNWVANNRHHLGDKIREMLSAFLIQNGLRPAEVEELEWVRPWCDRRLAFQEVGGVLLGFSYLGDDDRPLGIDNSDQEEYFRFEALIQLEGLVYNRQSWELTPRFTKMPPSREEALARYEQRFEGLD